MEDQAQRRYDFEDEEFWESPQETPQAPEQLPAQQSPQQGRRRLKRRTFLLGISAAGIGLVGGAYGGYRLLASLLRPNDFNLAGPLTTPNDLVIYTKGQLSANWQDWSWTQRNFHSQAEMYQNQPTLEMRLDTWGALQLHHVGSIDLTDFGYLQFYVNGGSGSDQKVSALFAKIGGEYTPRATVGLYTEGGSISSGTWKLARIPLQAMQAAKLTVSGVLLQDASGSHQSDISITDLRLVYAPDLTPPHLVQAVAFDLQTITLVFDKRMLPDDAQAPHFYSISSTDPAYTTAQAPQSAHYHSSSQSVSLLLQKPMQPAGRYTVTIGALRDKYGVAVPDPSIANVTAQ